MTGPFPPTGAPRRPAALLLFLSGLSALVYQIVWIKQLGLVAGVDVHAVAAGVAAFFAGLALGGWLFGRLADRTAHPLRLYALIEIGVAALGLVATLTLAGAAPTFVGLEGRVGSLAWLLPATIIVAPATLMGGTLPTLMRAVAPSLDRVASTGGRLYAANTAGAIAGAVATPFVLIPWRGVTGAAMIAAAANVLLAAIAWGLDRRRRAVSPPSREAPGRPAPHAGTRLALTLYAIAGGLALGYEVVWSQVLVQLTSTRTMALAIVLAVYLAGLALGSAAYARVADRVARPWAMFGLLIAGAGLTSLLLVATVGPWLLSRQSDVEELLRAWTGSEVTAMGGRFVVAAVAVVLPPTLLLGAAFPAAMRLAAGVERLGRDVGVLVALNTVGGIAGTLITGFVLVPAVGVIRSLAMLAIGAAAVGLVAVRHGHPPSRRLVAAIAATALVLAIVTPRDRLAQLLPVTRGGTVIFHEEGRGGAVSVVEQESSGRRFRRLYVQGVSNSGDAMPSLRYMRLQALLPLLIHHDEPRSALVIGFGTGITAGALLRYPSLERRVCAELLPSVLHAAPLFRGSYDAATDPRLTIRLRDGRHELLASGDRYDLITLEPPPPSAAGVVNLYSRDFYRLAATRLEPSGLVAQWWPLPTQDADASRSLVRSFIDVFPYATLWTTELHEMLLVGSLEPLELDAARITARFVQPEVQSALREVGVFSPAALLATWVSDRAALERFANTARPVTDDDPRLEYAPWVRTGEIARVLPELLTLQTPPALLNADEDFVAEVTNERRRLHRFYDAGLGAYTRDYQRWTLAIADVMREDAGNPYYRWSAR